MTTRDNIRISLKYNIAFVVRNCTLPMLETLEPWCDRIYIDDDMQVITTAYIESEQPKTAYDLTRRVLVTNFNAPSDENDIIVAIDAKQFTQTDFVCIQNLGKLISESELIEEFQQPGEQFTVGNLMITVWSTETYENRLIKCN